MILVFATSSENCLGNKS